MELSHESAFALLKHGANVNAENDSGDTPLHLAAQITAGKKGSYDMLEILLGFGAEEHVVNVAGCTALVLAEYNIEWNKDLDDPSRQIRETDDCLNSAARLSRRQAVASPGTGDPRSRFPVEAPDGPSRRGG